MQFDFLALQNLAQERWRGAHCHGSNENEYCPDDANRVCKKGGKKSQVDTPTYGWTIKIKQNPCIEKGALENKKKRCQTPEIYRSVDLVLSIEGQGYSDNFQKLP